MSYSVQSYLTDSTAIKKLYGSKDQELLGVLLEKLSDELNDLNDYFDDLIEGQNAQAILTDIVNGEIRFPKLGFMYSYVYEKLCKYYGEAFFPPNDKFNEYSTEYYWAIPKEIYKAFIPIPFSDDFPEIYSILNEDLLTEKERFLALKPKEGLTEENLKIEKDDFAFAFDKAIKEEKDLVFFLY